MNLFKIAFKVVRTNSKEIYKGFGFNHLSDATQYYVHPDNQSYTGTTTLCQPIGEAIILFSRMLSALCHGDKESAFGDFWFNSTKNKFYLELNIPEDYRENKVLEPEIFSYRAYLDGADITIGAYDSEGKLIKGDMEHLRLLYKLLPSFCILAAREMEKNSQYRATIEQFIDSPEPDTFVNLNEDLYQMHKYDEYELFYEDVPVVDKEEFISFSSSYETIRENKNALKKSESILVESFAETDLSQDQKSGIPRLSQEFVLPNKLKGLCNAIQGGDILSVLFHGPAGTGKTISCKLVCQAIGLPLMETMARDVFSI